MIVIDDIEQLNLPASAVTTGNFDGVHKGHQFLLKQLVGVAQKLSVPSVVVMFSPHPRQVLRGGDDDFRYLTDDKTQEALLATCGVDYLVKIHFTKEMAAWSAGDFISRMLVAKLGMKFYLVGYDHRLGNPKYDNDLKPLAEKYGFELKQEIVYKEGDLLFSSTAVRNSLAACNVALTAELLGRNYGFRCTVISGKRIGRTIGYPTANLKPCFEQVFIPADGVYVVKVSYDGAVYGGMMQVGHRPTLDDSRGLTLEVHIFDFDKDIYHRELELSFVAFLRKIERFDGLDTLVQQLQVDEVQARRVLGS